MLSRQEFTDRTGRHTASSVVSLETGRTPSRCDRVPSVSMAIRPGLRTVVEPALQVSSVTLLSVPEGIIPSGQLDKELGL